MRMDRALVVAIDCINGGSRAEEWALSADETLQTGDVLQEILISNATALTAPFRGGRAGIQKALHAAFKRGDTSVQVRVRRAGGGEGRLHACVVPQDGSGSGGGAGRRHYVLRSIRDPNYVVALVDRLESECIAIQGSRSSRVVCALSKAQLQDGYVSYSWDKKMKETLPITRSSSFLSMLVLPKALDEAASRYNSLEDTLARANAWFLASQASGVPIMFMNIQTEALLTKISGETASATVNSGSLADLSKLANASLYGFEDYHGVDIGVVKAVRMWYTATAGEVPLEITLEEGDTRLGFAISRTEEGFIYISSVIEDDARGEVPSTRCGLRDLFQEARSASKLLVVSRVSNCKVLPWMVSTSGAIRCFDTVSLSQKLSLHRHALQPILLHVLMWEKPGRVTNVGPHPLTPFPATALQFVVDDTQDRIEAAESPGLVDGAGLLMNERDTAGDISFRFHNFSLPNNWV